MRRNTKDLIFEAAVDLFSKKGFHGTSMRDISKDVGIKESSLYNHYSGKKAIMESILKYQIESFQGSASSLDELKATMPETSDPVEFWLAGVMAFVKTQPPLVEPISRIIINEMFLNSQCREFVLTSYFAAQKDLTETIFQVMVDKKLIRECDVRKKAVQYVYMVQGMEIENKLLMMEGQSPEKSLQNLLEHVTIFIEGMK